MRSWLSDNGNQLFRGWVVTSRRERKSTNDNRNKEEAMSSVLNSFEDQYIVNVWSNDEDNQEMNGKFVL